ncbi:MAG: hypothetical protein HYX54_05035 [Chloroflexi bacterium]|nr:hypothetical protein [Chloroflexota bacterium]
METRDRRINIGLFIAAAAAWIVVAAIVLTLDPVLIPASGYLGALAIGVAIGLTAMPLFWLVPFARQGRIALRGSWTRAVRRGVWTGLVALLLVVLRLEALFQLPVALFITAMVIVAETTLSMER